MKRAVLLSVLAAVLAAPSAAQAFCGFYVSGADGDLFNNATQVVLMRKGTRTVLSMQNNYQGPPQDFAMVVPVPVILQKQNVVTLPREVFRKVDQLSAPRLVEYWEQDPCRQIAVGSIGAGAGSGFGYGMARGRAEKAKDLGVTVEAKFAVGEYQIVILSARDAAGLDTWLRQEKYTIPEGAEPYLKPYVEGGSKFFVAKVDIAKVKFENGQAMLSPLRFHYDAESFSLPIRLGMMNSAGTQDLIVHILAPGQRYEVANYENVTIPTNLDVKEEARDRFGEFYAALFDRTLEKNPGAVVTEYAWDAGSCDPCPTPPLDPGALATLGGDVLSGGAASSTAPARGRTMRPMYGFVLTRLHARYSKDGINEDLVFKAAPAIAGGREWRGRAGTLEEGKVASPINNFQARYAIRHEWTGPMECANPVRGIWGGPPSGGPNQPRPALDLAFVARGQTQLASIVRQDVPEIGITAEKSTKGEAPAGADPAAVTQALNDPGQDPAADQPRPPAKEKQGCAAGGGGGGWLGVLWAGLALLLVARRDRKGRLDRQEETR